MIQFELPKEYLREDMYEMMKQEFITIMKYNKLEYEEILDYDSGIRIISFKKQTNEYGRFYFRYGVMMLYKYIEEDNLDKVEYWKLDKDKIFQEDEERTSWWNYLIKDEIPKVFQYQMKGLKYKLRYIYSLPPFIDESHEIVNQDVRIYNDYDNIPSPPKQQPFILEILGELYVCRRKGGREFEGFVRGQIKKNKKNVINAILLDDYMDYSKKVEFIPLYSLLRSRKKL